MKATVLLFVFLLCTAFAITNVRASELSVEELWLNDSFMALVETYNITAFHPYPRINPEWCFFTAHPSLALFDTRVRLLSIYYLYAHNVENVNDWLTKANINLTPYDNSEFWQAEGAFRYVSVFTGFLAPPESTHVVPNERQMYWLRLKLCPARERDSPIHLIREHGNISDELLFSFISSPDVFEEYMYNHLQTRRADERLFVNDSSFLQFLEKWTQTSTLYSPHNPRNVPVENIVSAYLLRNSLYERIELTALYILYSDGVQDIDIWLYDNDFTNNPQSPYRHLHPIIWNAFTSWRTGVENSIYRQFSALRNQLNHNDICNEIFMQLIRSPDCLNKFLAPYWEIFMQPAYPYTIDAPNKYYYDVQAMEERENHCEEPNEAVNTTPSNNLPAFIASGGVLIAILIATVKQLKRNILPNK